MRVFSFCRPVENLDEEWSSVFEDLKILHEEWSSVFVDYLRILHEKLFSVFVDYLRILVEEWSSGFVDHLKIIRKMDFSFYRSFRQFDSFTMFNDFVFVMLRFSFCYVKHSFQ